MTYKISIMVRASAACVIEQVVAGRSLSVCLAAELVHFTDKRDQAFLQALCYGVCRWYFRLNAMVRLLLQRPFRPKDHCIHSLLLVGAYQLLEMRVPTHAAVTATVAATVALRKPWAKKVVNAVLREFVRRSSEMIAMAETTLEGHYAHPAWLIEKIQQDWPLHWRDILIANNQAPPMTLRVNARLHAREAYLKKLIAVMPVADQVLATIVPETSHGIILTNPIDVDQLPGFAAGEVSVQDGAAQLAVELLQLSPGLRVLDACAAPGGKTAHILESQPHTELIAIDHDAGRLAKVHATLARLKLVAQCICADVSELSSWWDGQPFDRILLDVPCSASGVVRRHPDIKLLRRSSDVLSLAAAQKKTLRAAWRVLKPGGLLVYATCSIFPEENDMILSDFIAHHADATTDKINVAWGLPCRVGQQILPGHHGMDGFYFGRLRKGKEQLCASNTILN